MAIEGAIRPEDVVAFIRKRPFCPFRLYMSDGKHFDVPHPEFVTVGIRTVMVGVPSPSREGVAQEVHHCSVVHITRIEERPDAA